MRSTSIFFNPSKEFMRLPEDEDPPLAINIVPAIDVVFAILTFFIVSSLFLTRSPTLDVNLPNATTSVSPDQIDLNVSIDATGAIAVNRQSATLETLETVARQQLSSRSGRLVVISADLSTNHGQVIAVMDRLGQIEGVKLTLATEE